MNSVLFTVYRWYYFLLTITKAYISKVYSLILPLLGYQKVLNNQFTENSGWVVGVVDGGGAGQPTQEGVRARCGQGHPVRAAGRLQT